MDIPKIQYPDLLPEYTNKTSLRCFLKLIKNFGPAAIVASISVGAGETVLAVRVGAWAGYSMMWIVLFAAIIKSGLITYLLGRYTVLSGELISARMAKFPGPKNWVIIFVFTVQFFIAPFFASAIAGACGGLLHNLTAIVTPVFWAILFIIISITSGTLGSFKYQERLQIFICGILVLTTASGAIFSHPSILEILKGIFKFGYVPEIPNWALADSEFSARSPLLEVATTFGYIGGSMATYAIYANWTSIHGWGLSGSSFINQIRNIAWKKHIPDYLPAEKEEVKKGLLHLLPVKYDVVIGMMVLLFVSWSFMIAGAAIMKPHELLPSGYVLLTKQKTIWEQINPLLVPVYYVAILASLWGTLYAIPEMNIRLSYEFGSILFQWIKKFNYKKFSIIFGIYLIIGSMFILLSGIKPVRIMDFAAMIDTNIGNTVLLIIGLWLNLTLPRPYHPGTFIKIAAIASIFILAFSSYLSVVNF